MDCDFPATNTNYNFGLRPLRKNEIIPGSNVVRCCDRPISRYRPPCRAAMNPLNKGERDEDKPVSNWIAVCPAEWKSRNIVRQWISYVRRISGKAYKRIVACWNCTLCSGLIFSTRVHILEDIEAIALYSNNGWLESSHPRRYGGGQMLSTLGTHGTSGLSSTHRPPTSIDSLI